jgi:hypothetical protein
MKVDVGRSLYAKQLTAVQQTIPAGPLRSGAYAKLPLHRHPFSWLFQCKSARVNALPIQALPNFIANSYQASFCSGTATSLRTGRPSPFDRVVKGVEESQCHGPLDGPILQLSGQVSAPHILRFPAEVHGIYQNGACT